MSVILKTTLIKHWHYKEKFDADHLYGRYHHHHHHHHHKHHYCFRVEKLLLSICLSSELALSILFSSILILFVIIFITILLSFVVVLCSTCFILLFFLGGSSQVWDICQDCALAPGTLLFLLGD